VSDTEQSVVISGSTAPGQYDYAKLVDDLVRLVRLRTTPIGIKLFASKEEMEAIPKVRRPKSVHTFDQIVSQASRIGWTVGITQEDLVGAQCGAVIGLHPQDEEWRSGKRMVGVWYETIEDTTAHQAAMHVVPFGTYQAAAVSPLVTGRLDPPDVCLLYANPAQMILMINGLQWSGYKNFEWGCVGESACADSWGRALATREPSVSLPCFAERRYGGVPDDELLMATPPEYLPKMIAGLEQLSRNGLRYPIPTWGIQADSRAGLGYSYNS
jgi:uncharacterized protein (DUF169 family)